MNLKRLSVIAASFAVLGTIVALPALAGVATNYNTKQNPPHEYVCDNDTRTTGCAWQDKYRNLTKLPSPNAWASDYRRATTNTQETQVSRWQVTPPNAGRNWQIWAHIPSTVTASANHVPYTAKACGFDETCTIVTLQSGVDQEANAGTWVGLANQVYIPTGSSYVVAASNYDPVFGAHYVIYDAIDFWDYTN